MQAKGRKGREVRPDGIADAEDSLPVAFTCRVYVAPAFSVTVH